MLASCAEEKICLGTGTEEIGEVFRTIKSVVEVNVVLLIVQQHARAQCGVMNVAYSIPYVVLELISLSFNSSVNASAVVSSGTNQKRPMLANKCFKPSIPLTCSSSKRKKIVHSLILSHAGRCVMTFARCHAPQLSLGSASGSKGVAQHP